MNRSIAWGARVRAALLLAVLAVMASGADAAIRTWTGASSTLWSDAGNWGGTAPAAGDDLVFPAGASNASNTNDFAAGTSFSSILVDDPYSISGNAITLTAANALTFGSVSDATISFGVPVTVTNPAAAIGITQADGITLFVTMSGSVTISGGTLNIPVVGNLSTLVFAGSVGETAPAALIKTGNGEARLAVDNNFSGQTSVNQGYLRVNAPNALGTGTNSPGDGTVVNNGGSLVLTGAAIPNERIVLNGAGQSGNGALQTAGAASSLGGDLVLATPNIAFNSLGASLTITGKITGPGDLAFGRSPVFLSNPANDYGGATVIGNPGGSTTGLILGASNVIPDGSAVTILPASLLDLNGKSETIASLAGQGTLAVNGGALIVGDGAFTTFDGTITGPGTVSKVGVGSITLTGNSSAFGGVLAIVAGTVVVDGQLGGIVTLQSGTLAGTGTVGFVNTSSGGSGKVSPGGNSVGVLTATSLVLANGNQLGVQINGTTPGTQYDQLVAGSVTLGGTLAVSLALAPAIGDTFRIIDNLGGPVNGTFSGLPQGATFNVGTSTFQISYVGGDGNDVTLTAVLGGPPTPSISTTSPLPGGMVGTAYSTTIVGSGGTPPYTWSVSAGALPGGLTLNASTGAITGTPTAAGTFNFTITLTDNAAQTASKPFSLTIAPATLAVTTTSLSGGIVGSAYAASLAANGGTPPYTWSVSAGTLPPGVILNASTGALSGSPTTAGTFVFTVTVTDSAAATASMPLSITIAAAPSSAAQAIPALGPVALLLLALLTGAAGAIGRRRRS